MGRLCNRGASVLITPVLIICKQSFDGLIVGSTKGSDPTVVCV